MFSVSVFLPFVAFVAGVIVEKLFGAKVVAEIKKELDQVHQDVIDDLNTVHAHLLNLLSGKAKGKK